MSSESDDLKRVRVWDLPTRLFHWLLAALVLFAWWSASARHIDWHRMAGSAVAGLLVFRLWWGVFGGSTARFSQFVRGPRAVIAYARHLFGREAPTAGHNPMGGWSVLALLTAALATVGFGLFAVDVDGLESGPLARFVDFDTGRTASHLHGDAFTVLEAVVALHLVAIAFYALVKRENLVRPMVDGDKRLATDQASLQPARGFTLLAGLVLGGAVTGVLLKMGA